MLLDSYLHDDHHDVSKKKLCLGNGYPHDDSYHVPTRQRQRDEEISNGCDDG
jgi:hypothetical protein